MVVSSWGATLVLVLMEEQRDATLPLQGSYGHAERSSEQATDIVCGFGVVGDAQKVRTSQLLHDSLVPFDHRTLDSIGLEKSKDVLGNVMCVLGGGGGGGMSRNPNYDGTNSVRVLPVLAVCDETSCIDGRVVNPPIFEELTDLGSDRALSGVLNTPIGGLGRKMKMRVSESALGDGRDPSGRGRDGRERYCASMWLSPSPR